MSRRRVYVLLVLASALPRLLALVYERDDIFASFRDKSDTFARTFVETGSFGFIPDHPSAYTQPLYGFFLTPIYWAFGQSWLAVGVSQIAVAAVTALIVFEIGRRVASARIGFLGAVLTTVHPYLVWHDIHLNREVVDGLVAAAIVLLTLLAGERLTMPRFIGLGATLGLAVLGNVRLALLPVLVIAYIAWRQGFTRQLATGSLVMLIMAGVLVTPWVVRNRLVVGCSAVTTDSRALWKANNLNTRRALDEHGWIDYVPNLPNVGPSPQTAGKIYADTGRVIEVDECGQMHLYQDLVFDFWREHPGEKARLAVRATQMLWSPRLTLAEERPGGGTWLDVARVWLEPPYVALLYLLAIPALMRFPRHFAVLAIGLLLYQTLIAMVFVGATRYRVPWDFLIALFASATLLRMVDRVRTYSRLPSAP